jgi:hypothetical protein
MVAFFLVLAPRGALAQVVQVTPNESLTPGPTECSLTAPGVNCGAWTFWMAILAVAIGVLVLIAVVAGYLRFSPKFFGRAEPASTPPGTRPAALTRQAAAVRAPAMAGAPARAGAASVTTVEERPPPTPAPEPAPAAEAAAEPEPEPTVEAAEAIPPASAEATAPAAAAEAPDQEAAAPAAPAPASGGAEIDQETYDRVLKEQLDKGVDRRMAEGRARAAGVREARKKAQG